MNCSRCPVTGAWIITKGIIRVVHLGELCMFGKSTSYLTQSRSNMTRDRRLDFINPGNLCWGSRVKKILWLITYMMIYSWKTGSDEKINVSVWWLSANVLINIYFLPHLLFSPLSDSLIVVMMDWLWIGEQSVMHLQLRSSTFCYCYFHCSVPR